MAAKKSPAEARVERLTWGLLVLIFAVLYLLTDGFASSLPIPNWAVPMAGAIILLGSGMFQYGRKWRVSPVTWIGGVILLILALVGLYIVRDRQFIVESLLISLLVIIFGTFSGET